MEEDEPSSFFPREMGKASCSTSAEFAESIPSTAPEFLKVPNSFYRKQQWTSPKVFQSIAKEQTFGSISKPRFPRSRLVLWDKTAFGQETQVSPQDVIPRLQLTGSAVDVMASLLSKEEDRATMSSVVSGTGIGQRLTLNGKPMSGGRGTLSESSSSISGFNKTFEIEVLRRSEGDSVEEIILGLMPQLEKELEERLASTDGFGFGALLPFVCTCSSISGLDGFRVIGSLLVPNLTLRLKPIYPLLVCDTTLSKSLWSYLKKSKLDPSKMIESTGFLSMDQGHRLLPLLDNDQNSIQMPMVGFWVSCGASGVKEPIVWAAAVRFLYNTVIEDRALQSNSFLLLLYAAGTGSPQCFECSFDENSDGSLVNQKLPPLTSYVCHTRAYTSDSNSKGDVVLSGGFQHFSKGVELLQTDTTIDDKKDDQSTVSGVPATLEGGPTPRHSLPKPHSILIEDFKPEEMTTSPVETDDSKTNEEIKLSDVTGSTKGMYWSPYGSASMDKENAGSKVIIQKQQQQLCILQEQMKILQQQLSNVMNTNSVSKAQTQSQAEAMVLGKASNERGAEEKESTSSEKESNKSNEKSDDTFNKAKISPKVETKVDLGARVEPSIVEETKPVQKADYASKQMPLIWQEGDVSNVQRDKSLPHEAVQEDEASYNVDPGQISVESSYSDDSKVMLDSDLTIPACVPLAYNVEHTIDKNNTYIPRIRYTPLSDDDSDEDEETNRIISKYVKSSSLLM